MNDGSSTLGSVDETDEVRRLRSYVRDLVAVSTFPAAWVGREPAAIVESILDIVQNMLRLDLTYAYVSDPTGGPLIEAARDGAGPAGADRVREIGRALRPWLRLGDASAQAVVPDLLDIGTLRLAIVPVGLLSEVSLIAAGARRADFPTELERLLLSIIANQAAVALQQAGLLAAQRRAEQERNLALAEAVSERRRVAESEERYRSLVDTTSAVVWTTDAAGGFTQPQHSWVAYTGQPWPEHAGWGWATMIHPEDRDDVRALWSRAIVERSTYESEGRIWHAPSGQYRYFLARAVPLLNADRTVREWIGAIVDDDARKRSEDALQEEARIIETLHHVGSIVAAELDLEAIVRAVTDAATELSGAQFGAFFYNAVNEQGESYMLYTLSGVPREAFERFPLPRNTELFDPTFRGQGTVRLDDVIRDARYGKSAPYYGMPAGHLPVRSYLAVPVVSRSGEVLGGLFFGHPEPGVFTERAERLVVGIAAQAAVAIDNARLYAQAREAASAREQFLSIAAHELKTPLTTVKGSVQLLGRRLRQADLHDERILRLINQLERESERMETLVADLLDAARIQQGRLNLRTERVDLADLARQAIERFEEAPERTARHRLVLDAPSPVEGAWDPAMLDQMLTNLVSNGLRYSPDGGEVAIRVRAADAYAELSVSDHGIGISPDELPTVFQPFVRGASARQSVRGTGLGLHITARIVERHGGTISVESTPGAGSTFIVRLPLLQAASQGDRSEDVLITEPANPPLSATSPA